MTALQRALKVLWSPVARLRELSHSAEDVAAVYPDEPTRSAREAGATAAVSGMAQQVHTDHTSF